MHTDLVEEIFPSFLDPTFALPHTKKQHSRGIIDTDDQHGLRRMFDPIVEQEIVLEQMRDPPPIGISGREIRNKKRISGKFVRPVQQAPLPLPIERGEKRHGIGREDRSIGAAAISHPRSVSRVPRSKSPFPPASRGCAGPSPSSMPEFLVGGAGDTARFPSAPAPTSGKGSV